MPGGKRDRDRERAENEPIEELEENITPGTIKLLEMMMARQRQSEEEREEERRRLQKEQDLRQFEQQKELLRLQQEYSERGSVAQREVHDRERKRDRALHSIPLYKEGDDLEDFFVTVEHRLRASEIEEREWTGMLDTKFCGKTLVAWRDVAEAFPVYKEAKLNLLRSCGYTPKVASDNFFGFKPECCKGLTGDQLYLKGQQLLRRMVAPERLSERAEFAIVKGWVYSVVPRRARMALDARAVDDSTSLVSALQDFLSIEGEKGDSQVASFKKGMVEHKERMGSMNCFKCGKSGHKAADCWGSKGSREGAYKSPSGPGKDNSVEPNVRNGSNKIVCYTCGVEGHKMPQCPRKAEFYGKDVKVKPVKRLKQREGKCVRIDGKVNGFDMPIMMDSGAELSVVPEDLVSPRNLTGERVVAAGLFHAQEVPVAIIPFRIGQWEWMEEVAVAPKVEGNEAEVIYGLDLTSKRDRQLIELIEVSDSDRTSGYKIVHKVSTRSSTAKAIKEAAEEAISAAEDDPIVKPCIVNGQASVDSDVGRSAVKEVVLDVEKECLSSKDEELKLTLGLEKDASVEGVEDSDLGLEECYVLRKESRDSPEIEIPCVRTGSRNREKLKEEVLSDPTLDSWRKLADKGEQGFVWRDGMLCQSKLTHTAEKVYVLVLPKSVRRRVLEVAHEGLQHIGARRVRELISQRFSWPGLGQDAISHVRSCDICQRNSKIHRKVPMVARKVLTEPFEVMGVDIVGPFPKGKGGNRFLLTCICLASKWPEAVVLKTIAAKNVAIGLMDIFTRTGIPLQILSDQGSQFIGKVVGQLCKSLHIDRLKTAPYHPEANGTIERMHGTLGAMLSKAASQKLDWVDQVPFALFALRAAPNRETGFSPFELCFGRQVRTPLDVLHQGWADTEFEKLDTQEWAYWLVARLRVWHSVLQERGDHAVKKRKESYDRKAVERSLKPGDLVLCRIPGMTPKLADSWHGPYRVLEKVNQVDYRIEFSKKRKKVLHVNNLKLYMGREVAVKRIAIVAEDFSEDECVRLKMDGFCEGFEREKLPMLLEQYPDVISDVPGRTEVAELKIETGICLPIASKPYRVPDKLKSEVRAEVEKLVDMGVVIESVSPWASPIVPVPKADGTLRLCIDYRKLNNVTQGDPYYMTTLEEIVERVGSSRCLSKLDLSKGFYQIAVGEDSVDKTAFVTPFGKYAFTRMPFGLKNVPSIFQRTMEVVLRGCYMWAAPYIDDVVVFSNSGLEHMEHLRLVFETFRKFGLTVKLDKCSFGRKRLEYLGHMIGDGKIAVPEHRAEAMANYRQPRTKKDLRAFLGSASYYRRFVQDFASYSSLLSPATSKKAPSVVSWDQSMLDAFHSLRVSLVDVCVLTVPSLEDVFILNTDASGAGIGAALYVVRDDVELPVAFFSKQLQGAQKMYSATELEGLAMFKAIHHFAHFLWGRRFTVRTDHSALVQLLKSQTLNNRLHGWVLQLMSFDFEVVFRPGAKNLDADGLSRQA